MPPKKPSKSSSTNRGRSKSVGRASSRSRSRTPSRSRSRSRVVAKKTRTPASESKIRRRRSPSASSSSDEMKISRSAFKSRKSVSSTPSDKRLKSTPLPRETGATRSSHRIIQKVDITRTSSDDRYSVSRSYAASGKCTILFNISSFFREKICPSPVLSFLCLVTLLPTALWLNLLVLQNTKAQPQPSHQFAGVSWPTDWRVYFDFRCLLFVVLYLMIHLLIARFVPIGYKMDLSASTRRRYNGLFALVAFCSLYACAQYCTYLSAWNVKPTVLLPKYHINLLIATGKVAFLAALAAYFLTRRIPRSQLSSEGNTGNFLVDFWHGRSTRPRWFGLDWKIILFRPGVIALLLVEVTYLLVQWEQSKRVSVALAAMVAMHSILYTDFFIFEYAMAYSFEVRHEGFGYYSIAGTLLLPFIYSVGAVYLSGKPDIGRLYDANGAANLPNCALLGASIALFLVGYWIYRASNNQKDLFRRQPTHPSFGALDKISGPSSSRLLAGGWWGFVRHPNYLGDLMMAYAFALPAGFNSIFPWLYPIFLTCFLLHRIWRTESINAAKYGVVMAMYKKLVPSRLIPRIF